MNKFKKHLTIGNLFFLVVLGLLLFRQAPSILNNLEHEGKVVPKKMVKTLPTGELIQFAPNKRAMAIFWMTTCGPCKVEMQRLKSSVEAGNISKTSIFAINPFESRTEINKFIAKNDFPFIFIEDDGLGSFLDISTTPTTIFLENGKINSMSSGMSLFGIWKAEYLLD